MTAACSMSGSACDELSAMRFSSVFAVASESLAGGGSWEGIWHCRKDFDDALGRSVTGRSGWDRRGLQALSDLFESWMHHSHPHPFPAGCLSKQLPPLLGIGRDIVVEGL